MAKPKIDDPKFGPLLRAVCNILKPDATDRVTLGLDARAMVAMHRRFEAEPQAYAHNPTGKLFEYIEKNGGVAGLAATVADSTEEAEERERPHPQPHPDPEPEIPELGPIALSEFAKQTDGIGTAQLDSDIRADDGGLFVALVRKHKGGSTILGCSSAAEQVQAAAASVAREVLPFLSPTFRALVDTIKSQSFPSYALPSSAETRAKWLQSIFADQSDVDDSE